MAETENDVKAHLRKCCAAEGWDCLALASQRKGWPDSCILGPNGRVAWAELKRTGASLNTDTVKRQRYQIVKLQERGHLAAIVVGKDGVDQFMIRLRQWFAK